MLKSLSELKDKVSKKVEGDDYDPFDEPQRDEKFEKSSQDFIFSQRIKTKSLVTADLKTKDQRNANALL